MTREEIIQLAIARLDDLARKKSAQWSDEFFESALDQAMLEAAERCLCVRNTWTFQAQHRKAKYVAPGIRIVQLDRLVDRNSGQEIYRRDRTWLTNYRRDWEDAEGVPRFYVFDQPNTFLLTPTPILIDGKLPGYRLDYFSAPAAGDEPDDIPEPYHRDLVYWIMYEAYLVRDVDTEDAGRAEMALAKFTQRFGNRPTARFDRAHQLNNARTVTRWGYV